jgi:hypothetical protein
MTLADAIDRARKELSPANALRVAIYNQSDVATLQEALVAVVDAMTGLQGDLDIYNAHGVEHTMWSILLSKARPEPCGIKLPRGGTYSPPAGVTLAGQTLHSTAAGLGLPEGPEREGWAVPPRSTLDPDGRKGSVRP